MTWALNLLKLIPGVSWLRYAVIAAMVAALAFAWWSDRRAYGNLRVAAVKAEWNSERLEIARLTLKVYENNTRAEQTLAATADQLRKAKDDRIAQIDANLTIALNGLRSRPDRPAASNIGVPPVASTGASASGCTGAELYRPDGQFLAGEATRATKLKVFLEQCYRQYDEASKAK